MKSLFAAAMMLAATPAVAQTSPAPAPTPAPAPAATPDAAATPAAKLTVDTPVETIAADPAGKAVLEKDIPGITSHPMYDSFKSMSLKALQPMSSGALTDEMLNKVAADLAALK